MRTMEELVLDKLSSIEALLRAQSNASLNASEAADYLGVSERTLLRYVQSGRLCPFDTAGC